MLATVSKPKTAQAEPGLVQTAFRLPPDLLVELDAVVEEVNAARPWPKMTRSDLVRIALGKMLKERPDWLGLPPAPDEPEPRR